MRCVHRPNRLNSPHTPLTNSLVRPCLFFISLALGGLVTFYRGGNEESKEVYVPDEVAVLLQRLALAATYSAERAQFEAEKQKKNGTHVGSSRALTTNAFQNYRNWSQLRIYGNYSFI